MTGLEVAIDGRVARLTLDRPDAGNAIDVALARGLRDAVRGLPTQTRVIVLAARGKVFCAGGDMREVMAAADPAAQIGVLADELHAALRALHESPAVVVAAVGGAAAGGGLGLVLHADVVIASDRARFLTAYESIAVTPDSGVSDLLPRTVGLHRALQLSMLGRTLDAATAEEWGLVAEVVPPEQLDARVSEVAASLASGDTAHLAATSRLYREQPGDHAEGLEVEAASIRDFAGRAAAQERLSRFAR